MDFNLRSIELSGEIDASKSEAQTNDRQTNINDHDQHKYTVPKLQLIHLMLVL